MVKNVFLHFYLVFRHKHYVFRHCMKAGLIYQGIVHDMSKFSPTELFESVKYYNGKKSPIDVAKDQQGYSKAWLHHKGRNPHHFEYWVDSLDNGGIPLQMPYKYALELICDYLAAGEAYDKERFSYVSEYEWWKKKSKKNLVIHPQTKAFIETMFSVMAEENSNDVLRQERSKIIYRKEEEKWKRSI